MTADECTVVIAPAEVLQALVARLSAEPGELVSCPDADVPRALDIILARKPRRVAIERLFAATSRGAALLTRLKADPTLLETEIRIVSHDSDYSRISPRRPVVDTTPIVPTPTDLPALDSRGTRRAPRLSMTDGMDILVDGQPTRLIDLSALGAQVVSSGPLKPNQRVRVSMVDERVTLRFPAIVVWAAFELPKGRPAPQYRAGLEFVNPDADGVGGYALRHRRATPSDA
jgi:PilZ domain